MPPSAVPSAAAIQTFCELVYAGVDAGWLVLSYPDPRVLKPDGTPALKSDWFDVSRTTWQALASAAARRARTCHVYFGVVLQQPDCEPGQFKRSRSATAYSVPGLWFDLDLVYGHHAASQLPQTDREALQFLAELRARPSLIIHSGGGLYGYWLFREPYLITSDEDRETIAHLSRQFTYTLVEAGKLRGWTLDALGDLARVLRPPGTINHKYGKLVELIHEGHERYDPSDFDWLEPLPEPARTQHQGTGIGGQPDLVTIAEHYGASLERKSATELVGTHPQHGSSTGSNFNVNQAKGLWHCWRHGTGGDALALIAVCEDLLPCDQAVSGALHGAIFARVVQIASETFQAGIQTYGPDQADIDNLLAHTDQGTESPTQEATPAPASQRGTPNVWARAISAYEFAHQADTVQETLVDNLIVPQGITLLVAPRGVGKSMIALALGIAASTGSTFLGKPITELHVLLIDRDNPSRTIRRRLRDWGVVETENFRVLSRNDGAPSLLDRNAWKQFPIDDYALVIIDSLGAASEGVSETEGRLTQQVMATLKDLAARGPAILCLDNTTKSALNIRGRGEKMDAVDIIYEIRDVSGWTPQGEYWWEDLPDAGEHTWAQRASRRKQSPLHRLAFIPSKFRPSVEPDPFIIEMHLGSPPWTIADVTAKLEVEALQQEQITKGAQKDLLRLACEKLQEHLQTLGDGYLAKRGAETFLKLQGLSWPQARNVLEAENGHRWELRPVAGRGNPIGVFVRETPRQSSAAFPNTDPQNDQQETLLSDIPISQGEDSSAFQNQDQFSPSNGAVEEVSDFVRSDNGYLPKSTPVSSSVDTDQKEAGIWEGTPPSGDENPASGEKIPVVGDLVFPLAADGSRIPDNGIPYPYLIVAIEEGPDGQPYARFMESVTGWPLNQCQKSIE